MNSTLSLLADGSTTLDVLTQILGIGLFFLLFYLATQFFTFYIKQLPAKSRSLTVAMVGIAASAFLILFVGSMDLPLFVLGLFMALILAMGLFHPALALAATLAFLILRPWEIRPDIEIWGVLPRLLLAVFVISFFLRRLRGSTAKISLSTAQKWLIILGVWIFLSTFVAGNSSESQEIFFNGFFKSLVVSFMIFVTIETVEDYKTVTGSVLVAVLGLALFALVNTLFLSQGSRLEGRGAIENANDLAAILIFALPFGLSPLLKGQWSLRAVAVSFVVFCLLLLGLWKAESRAAYMALFMIFVAFGAYRFRHRRSLLIKIGVASLAVLIVLSQLNLGRSSSDLEESRMNRLGYWKAGVAMAVRNPVLGVGLGQFPKNFQYYGAAEFSEVGERTAHSSWVLLLAEAGFPALIILASLYVMALIRAWRLMPVAPELFLSLVGYGVTMSFLSHVYTIYPYLILALVFSYPALKKGKTT